MPINRKVGVSRFVPVGILLVRLAVLDEGLIVSYSIDGDLVGSIRVSYPFSLVSFKPPLLGAIAAGLAVYVGQLCLAPLIELDFDVDPKVVEELAPIAEMLYDIRCWKDARNPVGPPKIVPLRPRPCPALDVSLSTHRSLLLFSGGKDSTLAALALKRNGYSVTTLHATANARVVAPEEQAARTIARLLDLDLEKLTYTHDDFIELSGRYAEHWDSFPHYNAVPFGRDMALSLLAIPVMLEREIGVLSLGHDHDCRNAHVVYLGKTIPRNDIESIAGSAALERYLQRMIAANVRMLPPLAQLSELRILREMFEHQPQLMRETSFCFWGSNCGRCGKCLRYFLAQRLFRREGTLRFASNPLMADACPELEEIMRSWGQEHVLFDKEVVFMLGRLAQRGQVCPGETQLERFCESIYLKVAPELDGWEREMMLIGKDPQVPQAFKPVLPR